MVALLHATIRCSLVFTFFGPGASVDSIPRPPDRQEYVSASKRFRFRLVARDKWKTPRSTGSLFSVTEGTPRLLWKKPMPNPYRPRFVLVTDEGWVLTFDDWENVKSERAIVIYKPDGSVSRMYSFDQVVAATGLSAASVVDGAKTGLGWWLGGAPRMEGARALVPVGSGQLSVQMNDGALGFQR